MTAVSELFKRPPIGNLIDEQLYDAQRKLLEHEAAAEHHAALAEMYRRRVMRLLQGSLMSQAANNFETADETAAIELKTGRRLRA